MVSVRTLTYLPFFLQQRIITKYSHLFFKVPNLSLLILFFHNSLTIFDFVIDRQQWLLEQACYLTLIGILIFSPVVTIL